jgi:hypothetical protein
LPTTVRAPVEIGIQLEGVDGKKRSTMPELAPVYAKSNSSFFLQYAGVGQYVLARWGIRSRASANGPIQIMATAWMATAVLFTYMLCPQL